MENWNKRVKRTCVGVLLLAILLRLGGSGPMAAPEAESAAAFFLYLQTGRVARPGEEMVSPAVTIPKETQPTTVFTFPTAPLDGGPCPLRQAKRRASRSKMEEPMSRIWGRCWRRR